MEVNDAARARSLTAARRRGADTQRLVASYWRSNGWPYATPVEAFGRGADLIGTPGISVEIKARRDFAPLAWLQQAAHHNGGTPVVIWRPDNAGPNSLPLWPVMMRHLDLLELLAKAGYGGPSS
jgi:hypothetical protein